MTHITIEKAKQIYKDAFEQGVHEGSPKAAQSCMDEYFKQALATPVQKAYRPLQDNGSQYFGDSWDTLPTQPAVPLTDDEIWKNDDIMAANSGYGADFETLRKVIRAIEAAHNIGVKK